MLRQLNSAGRSAVAQIARRQYSAMSNWATLDINKWNGKNPYKLDNLGACAAVQ
jgi:hypothetical protein